jgi:hypothetical protein
VPPSLLTAAAAIHAKRHGRITHTMGRTLEFFQVDVFGSAPLTGNGLCVFPQPMTLNTTVMQQIRAKCVNASPSSYFLGRNRLISAHGFLKFRRSSLLLDIPFWGRHP